MDIVYVALTVVFFAVSWGFANLCERLSDAGQKKPIHTS
jgi:hypothetical protein